MNPKLKRFASLFVLSAFLLSGRFAFGAVSLDGGSETYDARVDVVNELLSVDRAFDTYSAKHPEWLRKPAPVLREVTPSGAVNTLREGVDYRVIYSAGVVKFRYDLHPKSLVYADYSYTEEQGRERDDRFIDIQDRERGEYGSHEGEAPEVTDGGGGEGGGHDGDHTNHSGGGDDTNPGGHGNDGGFDNPGNGGGHDNDGGNPGDNGNGDHENNGNTDHGNNGVGNGVDPAPPGNPPVNDGADAGPGNPGNQGGSDNSNAGGNGNGNNK